MRRRRIRRRRVVVGGWRRQEIYGCSEGGHEVGWCERIREVLPADWLWPPLKASGQLCVG